MSGDEVFIFAAQSVSRSDVFSILLAAVFLGLFLWAVHE